MTGQPMPDELREVPLAQWDSAVRGARDEGFTFFDWLTAVDQSDAAEDPGHDLVLRLLAPTAEGLHGIRLTTRVPLGGVAPSLTGVFAGAAWHERETGEMFGIDFAGFDDGTGLGLRPLLLPDGFEGHPLRKSFQLAARASKVWPGGKEPGEGGEGHRSTGSPSRRRVQAPGVPPPEWGPR